MLIISAMYATRNVYHLAGHTALDNFKYSEMTGEKFVEFKVLIKRPSHLPSLVLVLIHLPPLPPQESKNKIQTWAG